MDKSIRVLIVEDSEDDALFLLRVLREGGFVISHERVDTPKAMQVALDRQEWDCVITDCVMPRFSGREALAMVREKGIDIPTIVVSGAYGEEIAVEVMTAGAHDYLMKGKLERIVPVLERELSEAEIRRQRKRAEEEIRNSEELFRILFEYAPDAYYLSDLKGKFIDGNREAEALIGYKKEELIGKNFLNLNMLPEDQIPKAVSLLAKNATGKATGPDELVLEKKDGLRMSLEIRTYPVKIRGETVVLGIARDITERKKAEERLSATLELLRKSLGATIQAISTLVETRDPYTAGHQRRVADLARAIAGEMRLPREKVAVVRMAGLIHDIGKISVPAEILSKPGRLAEMEFNMLKIHPQSGYEILKHVEFPGPVAQIILQHHERIDGSGYPQGLKDEEILEEAKILAVADVVEAMISHRPYRPARSLSQAVEEISKNSGVLYAPEVVRACLSLFGEKGFSFRDGQDPEISPI
jgi:PAS domain S-box-containing protein/putative nucleotidyltransferase with HDIG domain